MYHMLNMGGVVHKFMVCLVQHVSIQVRVSCKGLPISALDVTGKHKSLCKKNPLYLKGCS